MIYVKLSGGMGNQMFQYAFGRQVAQQLGTELSLDLTSLLNRHKEPGFVYRDYDLDVFQVEPNFLFPPAMLRGLFRIKHNRISKFANNLALRGGKQYVREPHFHFAPQLLEEARDNQLFYGWFQSPKYFADVEDDIRAAFRFRHRIIPGSQDLLGRIEDPAHPAVCLNVRRTDFLKVDTLNATNLDYFLRGAKFIGEQLENPRFFIFSDDVDWCRENLQLPYPTEVVGHEHKGFKFGNYLQLMSRCDHFVIPNSSFAWWAAWMNISPGKMVVAPKNWFTDPSIDTSDLVPKEWTRL
ncbi:hypothetical protein CEQ90_06540 [Lewinellaceae bacterium SD302]|nr:hypothetical protein CEQ90_06540 [Lewinellaceae bacterium SD302]